MKVEIIDLDKVISELASLGPKLMRAATVAAMREGQVVLRKTKHRVPYYTGELSKSGRVEGPDVSEGEATVSIAYGGPAGVAENTIDVNYAVLVHEDLEAKHLFGRTAKYIENPVREEMESGRSAKRMGDTIASEMGWPV